MDARYKYRGELVDDQLDFAGGACSCAVERHLDVVVVADEDSVAVFVDVPHSEGVF